ncbi:MAG: hypothetical protein J5667_06320 [Bacteroidales bacterium]|nr:hypothetical protein [Bacteroidales bacterium]
MRHRHDSQNMTQYDCPCEPIDEFIKAEAEKGERYTYMHVLIASLVRLIALFPRTNRFIMNGRIYKRNSIQISFVVKKGLSAEAPDTTVKLDFTGHESILQVRDMIDEAIAKNSNMDANNGTDKLARLITFTPNIVIGALVGLIKLLDKHGLLPKAVINVSPFHTTCFVTNLKSIKGPSIYHHLYDFGNTGMFFSMGKESMVPVVKGKEIVIGKRLPLWIVTDERFCDGFYFVSALKQLRILLADPSRMAEPLENLTEDTKVIDKHSYKK